MANRNPKDIGTSDFSWLMDVGRVVATAVGGLRTAVADGISGVLVDGHDPRAWSSVLARLIQEPQRRVLLSLGAIEHASHFGWDATARGTLDIYDRVLSDVRDARKTSGA